MMALFGLTRPVTPEPVLRGDGLYLRPAALTDYSSWSKLRAASRGFLEPWEPTWPDDDLTRAAFRRRLKRQDDDMARDEAYSFLIFDSLTDELLGGITLGGVRRGVSQSGTLGYWMGAPYAGRGRMTRAVAATVEFALAKLRLHRIEAACIPENAPSIALLERNGFRREGYAHGFLRINGAWRDHVLFGLVQNDARPRLAWTNLD
jgi:ribosomal-protein-alanine N-acetyltransferase